MGGKIIIPLKIFTKFPGTIWIWGNKEFSLWEGSGSKNGFQH